MKNYKYYELIKEIEEVLKNSENTKIIKDINTYYGFNGIEYTLEERFTGVTGNSVIKLRVYPLENGNKYELLVQQFNRCNYRNKCIYGLLKLKKEKNKITLNSSYHFSNWNNTKPVTPEQIRKFTEEVLKDIGIFNKLGNLLDNDYKKGRLAKDYILIKDLVITPDYTDAMIENLANEALKMEIVDKNELAKYILTTYFNLPSEKHFDILIESLKDSCLYDFLDNCINSGILKENYAYCSNNYYNMN